MDILISMYKFSIITNTVYKVFSLKFKETSVNKYPFKSLSINLREYIIMLALSQTSSSLGWH